MRMSLADRIRNGVLNKFPRDEVSRVITCWDNFNAGKKLHRYLDEDKKVLQDAMCYVDGLEASTFHDLSNYPWISELEKNYKKIYNELVSYECRQRNIPEGNVVDIDSVMHNGAGPQGDGDWVGPRDAEGSDYGPEWRTLGLQDRSVWSEDIAPQFPFTTSLLAELKVPSCEIFFAKQGPQSGIKPHSDRNNFIITCHLGLDVPEGQCSILVGDETYYWRNGKAVVFDTSVIHSTFNSGSRTRYVLLIRLWHQGLTQTERDAFKLIFDFLDTAAYGEEALADFEAQQLFMGKDRHQGLSTTQAPSAELEQVEKEIKRGKGKNKERKILSGSPSRGKGFGSKK